jgi:hypothetical protein
MNAITEELKYIKNANPFLYIFAGKKDNCKCFKIYYKIEYSNREKNTANGFLEVTLCKKDEIIIDSIFAIINE